MRMAKGRLKSLAGLKASSNMITLQRTEKNLERRKSVLSLDTIPRAKPQPIARLRQGVNVIRAAIKFRSVT